MQIHQLKLRKRKPRKTVGRGGKRGTYSGRGNKGQKARSGGNVDPLFEGGRSSLIDRLKKVRGFKSIHKKNFTVNLNDLEKNFKAGETISTKTLIESGLMSKKDIQRRIKVLSDGKITKKIQIEKDILISKKAKEAIEKSGGEVGL
jgi:large subunit ribosomal protein L15